MILIDAAGVSAHRPTRPLFDDVSLTLSTGDRLAVVGLNGCGKSTLLRVLAGKADPESGVVRRGRGVRLAMLDQDDALPAGTVADVVGGDWQSASILDRLGMTPWAGADTATLSGGQAKRVALARALVTPSDLLILDEPTNHLDAASIAWLEDHLSRYTGGLILVSHDRHVLDRVTTRILELDRGKGYVHEGGYASYLEAKVERQERAEQAEQVRRNLARTELAWLRRGAPARTRKPKARIDAALATVNGRMEAAARPGDLELAFKVPRLGDKVLEVSSLSAGWPGDRPVVRDLDLLLGPGDRLALVGGNGAGKSTLLDTLAGRLDPVSGTVVWGPTVQLGYFDQRARDLDPARRLREVVAEAFQQDSPELSVLLERFWFDADAQRAPIGTLSGGERRRLHLVLVLAGRPNVLLLDEPTNDLDLDTLRVLEDFCETWPGTLIAASHDRAFLERVVVDAVALDGTGSAEMVVGGYAAWRSAVPAAPSRTLAGAGPAPKAGDTRAPKAPGQSPSTLRRQMTQAERAVEKGQAKVDELVAAMSGVTDHVVLADLGAQLTAAQAAVEAAETDWLEAVELLEG